MADTKQFPDRLVGGSDSAFVSTAAELKCNRNPAIDVAADCLATPRRNYEADSAAPWQRRTDAKETAVVVAEKEKEETVVSFFHLVVE